MCRTLGWGFQAVLVWNRVWLQIYGYRFSWSGLKRGMKNNIIWSEIGSGFWELCGTPPTKVLEILEEVWVEEAWVGEGGQCLILIMDQHARRKRKEGKGKDSQLTSDCYVVWIASDAATAHAPTAASPFMCNLSNAHSIFICIAFCVNLVKKWKRITWLCFINKVANLCCL